MFNNVEILSTSKTIHYRVKYEDIDIENFKELDDWKIKELILKHYTPPLLTKVITDIEYIYFGVEYIDFIIKYKSK